MKKLYHIIFIFSVSMLSLVLAGTDGTVRGKVTDTDGNPLPGAQIFIKELQLGAIAGSDGSYILLNIPVGTYAVTVSMMGYRKETRKNVHVIMDQTVWLNFTLPIAAVEGEAVEVIADRPIMDPGATAKKITVSDEAIAALLHDAVEDQGGEKTLKLIKKKFGNKVAKIVEDCTDTKVIPKPPWFERKKQ